MVAGVEMPVESDRPDQAGGRPSAAACSMLGPLTVSRDGVPVALPASRKVRALLAYLALAPHAVTRSQLCELLWDVPNDPRGELRWCLSKLRSIVDEPGRRRVETAGDAVRLDLARLLRRCARDRPGDPGGHRDARARAAASAGRAVRRRVARRPGDRRAARLSTAGSIGAAPPLSRLPRRPAGAARRAASPDDEAFGYLEKWLAARAVRPARARGAARRARPARPHPRGRGASGGDRPAVRARGPRLRAAARRLAGSAHAGDGARAGACSAADRRSRQRPEAVIGRRRAAPRSR